MGAISAGQAIVRVLEAEGVTAVFGIPGGHTLPIYDALYDSTRIRHILVRHEQVAANMAAGFAQMTGEPGVCCVTAGPGATNLVSGIAEAYIGALPIVILAGRGPTVAAHRGASQEIAQEQLFRPITKWSVRVDRTDLIVDVLRQAFTVARSGKPGPVLVDFPRDILAQPVEFSDYRPVGRPAPPRANPELVRRAAGVLALAKRPLIIAGGGVIASGAWDGVRRLAESMSAPVVTTLAGRGSLPDDHPLAAGGIGHHRTWLTARLLSEADVVLGLGCRFEDQETNWRPTYVPDPSAIYIQVDIDPAEIGRSIVPPIGIVGDAALFIDDLLAELARRVTMRKPTMAPLRGSPNSRATRSASKPRSAHRHPPLSAPSTLCASSAPHATSSPATAASPSTSACWPRAWPAPFPTSRCSSRAPSSCRRASTAWASRPPRYPSPSSFAPVHRRSASSATAPSR